MAKVLCVLIGKRATMERQAKRVEIGRRKTFLRCDPNSIPTSALIA